MSTVSICSISPHFWIVGNKNRVPYATAICTGMNGASHGYWITASPGISNVLMTNKAIYPIPIAMIAALVGVS